MKRIRSPSMESLIQQDEDNQDEDSLSAPVELPEELWSYTLTFVEDTDLQTLAKTNRLLRRLASDRILWTNYLTSRNRFRIASRLFAVPQRPSRKDLVAWNILRTTPFRDITVAYINGPARVAHWTAQENIRKFFIYTSLQKALNARPSLDDLAARNVIPPIAVHVPTAKSRSDTEDTSGVLCCSPKLVPKALRLTKAIKEDKLKQSLRTRITVEDLWEKGLAKKHMVMKYCSFNPTLLATQVELDKKLTTSRIYTNLNHRPSVGSLESMKVLRTDPTTALMLCPPIRLKVRYFEDLSTSGPALSAEAS
ncbi:hypothetical protein DFJ77DRAFT_510545 [Powellomyces hirtus]|nr:hypothetical protein DFJ77DRAFT_510545 [Powellomyces hirtus]